MLRVNNKATRMISILNIFHTFSGVSIVDFKQVNVSWGMEKREWWWNLVALFANRRGKELVIEF